MERFPKLNELLLNALNQAASDGGMLLGQDITVKDVQDSSLLKGEYLARLEDASFFVGVRSQEDYEGSFYLVFSLRDAIVLGSLLLGVPPARVSEKKKLAILEPDDVDAFSEFTNQVIGSFNSVFKPKLPKKVHLKLIEANKFIPGESEAGDENPIADGEYYNVRCQLAVPQQDMDYIDVLIPISLASCYDLQDNAAVAAEKNVAATDDLSPGKTEEAEESESTGSDKAAVTPVVLILEDNSAEREYFEKALASDEIKAFAAPLDSDLGDYFNGEAVRAVLVGLDSTADRRLAICSKIKSAAPDASLPVIMCAAEWTKVDVLKALKYGASDILIKPCTQDELKGRVARFLDAA